MPASEKGARLEVPILRYNGKTKKSGTPVLWPIAAVILCLKSVIMLAVIFKPWHIELAQVLITIPPVLFLVSFCFLFRGRAGNIYLISLDVFLTLLFISDIIYSRAFGHLLNIYMMFATDNMNDLGESAFAMMRWADFLLLADIPALIFIYGKKVEIREKRHAGVFLIVSAASIAFMIFFIGGLEKDRKLDNIGGQPLLISPAGFHMYDIYQLAYEQLDSLDPKEIEEVRNWHTANEKYHEPDPAFAELEGLIKGKNIIAVQFESLENFLIGRSFFGQEITPNINRLLENSIYFDNIVTQVRDGNSSDAELLFNTSMYPISRGSTFFRFGGNIYASLPKLLAEQGYASAAIHGDNRTYWNRDEAFPAIGFDSYIDESLFTDKRMNGMGIVDSSLFSQSVPELQKLKKPFYFFMITLTSHLPFDLAEDMRSLDISEQNAFTDYLLSIHYTDEMFGAFYDRLETEGYLKDSVLVIYGDHEGIHKYYGADSELPENGSKVPFIIHIPGMKGFVSDKAGGQVDMMPTIMYLLGIEREKYAPFVMGRNLFGKYSGSALLPDGGIAEGADGREQLAEAQRIADLSIRGDYYKFW
jgi:phosphoglycerol transferase MdoB-like AlkP superfamily enzyme